MDIFFIISYVNWSEFFFENQWSYVLIRASFPRNIMYAVSFTWLVSVMEQTPYIICLRAIHVSIMYCIFAFLILHHYIGIYKNNYFGDLIGYDRKAECIHDYLIRCQRDCYGKMSKIVFQKLIKSERKVIFQL